MTKYAMHTVVLISVGVSASISVRDGRLKKVTEILSGHWYKLQSPEANKTHHTEPIWSREQ